MFNIEIDVERSDINELVGALAVTKVIAQEYTENSLPVPERLADNLDKLKAEVKARTIDELKLALARAEARQETLKTAEEKRKDNLVEINRLKEALGQTV